MRGAVKAASSKVGQKVKEERGRQARPLHECINELVSVCDEWVGLVPFRTRSKEGEVQRVYIPPLRTLRRLGPKDNVLQAHFHEAYGMNSGTPQCEVFTGHSIFEELKRLVTSGRDGRDKLRAFEDFVSDACYNGRVVSVSPREPQGETGHVEVHIEGEDSPRSIHELGDGVAQVIILAWPVFFRPARLFLVEEPELHLHPGMQRAIMRLYARATEGTFFISTHSNHFVDMAADEIKQCSILQLRRIGGGDGQTGTKTSVGRVDAGDLQLLHELGVTLSSVGRVNCTVWVEGITDRAYISRMLDLLYEHAARVAKESGQRQTHRRLHEHLHYGYVEYGGANVVHWGFGDLEDVDQDEEYKEKRDRLIAVINAERLMGTAIVVVDDDGGDKAWRDKDLAAALGPRHVKTAGREIENMVPASVLRAVLRSYKETIDLDELLPDGGRPWKDDYLGTWLDDALGEKRKRVSYAEGVTKAILSERAAAAASGEELEDLQPATVKDKTAFCEKALAELNDYEQLDDDVRDWVVALHKLIATANGIT
jgi:hypothetical protein